MTTVSPDEEVIIAVEEHRQEDIWLMENFDPEVP